MKYCPKCKSSHIVKSGSTNSKQRYTCKECKYNFTRKQLGRGKTNRNELIQQAIKLHLENMSSRGIGRILGVHYQTVINWINSEANKIDEKSFEVDQATIVELDELHLYLGKKN